MKAVVKIIHQRREKPLVILCVFFSVLFTDSREKRRWKLRIIAILTPRPFFPFPFLKTERKKNIIRFVQKKTDMTMQRGHRRAELRTGKRFSRFCCFAVWSAGNCLYGKSIKKFFPKGQVFKKMKRRRNPHRKFAYFSVGILICA